MTFWLENYPAFICAILEFYWPSPARCGLCLDPDFRSVEDVISRGVQALPYPSRVPPQQTSALAQSHRYLKALRARGLCCGVLGCLLARRTLARKSGEVGNKTSTSSIAALHHVQVVSHHPLCQLSSPYVDNVLQEHVCVRGPS
jgi:hypothetical protein